MPLRPADPLSHNVPIVDERGYPTPQFIQQWALVRAILDAIQSVEVEAGTYGGAGQHVSITVNAQGQITSIENA